MEASGQSTCSANISTKLSRSQLEEIPPRRASAPHPEQLCRGRSKRAGWRVCMQLTPSTGLIIYILTKPHHYPGYFRSRARACYRNKAADAENLHTSSTRQLVSCNFVSQTASLRGKGGFVPPSGVCGSALTSAFSPEPSRTLNTNNQRKSRCDAGFSAAAAGVFLWSVCGGVPSPEAPVNHVNRGGLLNRGGGARRSARLAVATGITDKKSSSDWLIS